jgi:hypothetical protein
MSNVPVTDTRWRDKHAKEKAKYRARSRGAICRSPGRFHVRPGNIVANALTYGKPWGSR